MSKLFEIETAPAAPAELTADKASAIALATIKLVLKDLTHQDTVAAVGELMALIPESQFEGIDVGRELLLQYQVVKLLQTKLLNDDDVPANQRAQVANAVSSTLQAITAAQGKTYSSERFKRIEAALVKVLNTFPAELTASFFEQYEKINAG